MKYLSFHITSPLESPNAGSREEKERNGGSGTNQIKETDLTYLEKMGGSPIVLSGSTLIRLPVQPNTDNSKQLTVHCYNSTFI